MRKLLPLLLLLPSLAFGLDVRVIEAAAQAGSGAQDFTSSGFGTPTAAIIEVTYATALNTDTAHASYSIGFTDCTNEASASMNAEDAVGVGDTVHSIETTKSVQITEPGAGVVERSADASCITDGIRLTWVEAGTAHLVKITMFTDVGTVLVGNATPNASLNSAVNITTTFTTKLGFFLQNSNTVTGTTNTLQHTLGVMHFATPTITQRAAYWRMENSDAAPTPDGGLVTNRATNGDTGNGTTPTYGVEVTAVTGTTVEITTRDNTAGGEVIYLLMELPSNDAWVGTSTSPVNASTDWTETGPGFTPVAFGLILTDYAAVDTIVEASDQAGSFAFFTATDDGAEFSAGARFENGAVNTDSRLDDKLYMMDEAGAADLNMDDPTFSATGFTFPNANITASDASVSIGWAIEADAGSATSIIRRRRAQ